MIKNLKVIYEIDKFLNKMYYIFLFVKYIFIVI